MKVTKLDHIGIAVKSIDDSLAFYRDILGINATGTETIADQKVRVAFLPLGDTELELLESTSPDGPVAQFIEKRGEGIQHPADGLPGRDQRLLKPGADRRPALVGVVAPTRAVRHGDDADAYDRIAHR